MNELSSGQPAASPETPAEETINRLLAATGSPTISCAESCTGGNVAARLSRLPGSSLYFLGGIVSYANGAKQHLLGVPADVLEQVGAVSPECAIAMAAGARRALGTDLAVSTTGIAGPTGATARKPVGLVYIALATPGANRVEEHHFPGDRAAITLAATERALSLLLEGISEYLDHQSVP